jgi:hypothetical protein
MSDTTTPLTANWKSRVIVISERRFHELEASSVAGQPRASLRERVLMPLIIVWGLVVHGITQIVTVSRIARPVREAAPPPLRAFLSCPMCLGFWVGLALSLSGLSPLAPFVSWPGLARAVADGAAASAVCWAAHVLLARLGALEL